MLANHFVLPLLSSGATSPPKELLGQAGMQSRWLAKSQLSDCYLIFNYRPEVRANPQPLASALERVTISRTSQAAD